MNHNHYRFLRKQPTELLNLPFEDEPPPLASRYPWWLPIVWVLSIAAGAAAYFIGG